MNKILLILSLSFTSLSAQAGFFSSFMGSVAANSLTGGGESYVNSDLKSMRKYVRYYNGKKQKIPGYRAFTDALESTNDIEFLSAAAYTHHINGDTKKALEIYEQRLLPISRIRSNEGSGFVADYRVVAGLSSSATINYDTLYKKNKARQDAEQYKLLKKEDKPRGYMKLIVYGFGMLAALLIIGIIIGIMIFVQLKVIKNNGFQRIGLSESN